MNDQMPGTPQNLNFKLPDLTFQFFSLVELAFVILLPILIYYGLRWISKSLRNLGAVNRDSLTAKILSVTTVVAPIAVLLYGFSGVAKESFFISLLFFVVISVVGAAAAIDPIKAVLASVIINTRGDLKLGDQIHIGELKGRIAGFGPFNLTVETATGSRVFIPNQHILKESYEVHSRSGGPMISVEVEGEFDLETVEKLAQFCPYKRENSEISVRNRGDIVVINMEVQQRDVRPWVQQYFRNFLGKRMERRKL